MPAVRGAGAGGAGGGLGMGGSTARGPSTPPRRMGDGLDGFGPRGTRLGRFRPPHPLLRFAVVQLPLGRAAGHHIPFRGENPFRGRTRVARGAVPRRSGCEDFTPPPPRSAVSWCPYNLPNSVQRKNSKDRGPCRASTVKICSPLPVPHSLPGSPSPAGSPCTGAAGSRVPSGRPGSLG